MSSEFSRIKGQRSTGAKAQRELIADYGDFHGLFIAIPINRDFHFVPTRAQTGEGAIGVSGEQARACDM